MPFITQGKANWKFLLIVVVLAMIVGVGMWVYSRMIEKEFEAPPVDIPEEVPEEEIEEFTEEETEVFEIEQYAGELCEKLEEKKDIAPPNRKKVIGTIISGSFSSPGVEEFFITCQDPQDPTHGDRYFYIINSVGHILFERESGYGRFGSLPFKVTDINDDGVLEIIWGYGIAGGGGTYAHTYKYIYSLKNRELFEMKHLQDWEWATTGKILVRDEIIFSDNLEKPELQSFKDYLLSEAYWEWYKTHGEYDTSEY